MPEQIINALNDGHRTMKHVITLLRVQLDVLQPDAHGVAHKDSIKFLHNVMGYMHTFPGLIHHPVEELIFERLVRYAPQATPLCAQLTEQHNSFSTQEIAIMGRISRAEASEIHSCLWLKQVGSRYCDAHEDHIDNEELKAFPQAIHWLSVADWDAVREQSRFDLDPLSDSSILAHYGNVYDYIMASSENFTRH